MAAPVRTVVYVVATDAKNFVDEQHFATPLKPLVREALTHYVGDVTDIEFHATGKGYLEIVLRVRGHLPAMNAAGAVRKFLRGRSYEVLDVEPSGPLNGVAVPPTPPTPPPPRKSAPPPVTTVVCKVTFTGTRKQVSTNLSALRQMEGVTVEVVDD